MLMEDGKAYEEDGSIKLRLKHESITLDDAIRGKIQKFTEFDNVVIMKSDGMPTFHFSNVVDDHEMEVTNVVRGEDHISNTFPQIQIYRALGWIPPEFAHLSLIFAPDRTKLSKRNGSKSISQYRDEGFLPQALFNYIALMGVNVGSVEILDKDELSKLYDVSKIKKSPVCYDEKKLSWFQRRWKQILSQ